MRDDFGGEDAFREVLDRLIAAEGKVAGANARTDDAVAEFDRQREKAAGLLTQNLELRKQADAANALHDLLKKIRERVGNALAGIDKDLLASLDKAIEDTDPIPF